MSLLKVIGSFFVRLWTWIKETAWVQPLLIVGAIFAIIFSIPSITSWIEDMQSSVSDTEAYFAKFEQTMEGGTDSKADKLIDDIDQSNSVVSSLGSKFFVTFYDSTNDSSESAYLGFETLEANWNKTYDPTDNNPFKLFTIMTNEETTQTTKDETAFAQFLDRNGNFFEEAAEAGRNTDYFLNKQITETDLEKLESVDPTQFITPTILLVEFNDEIDSYEITEVMFSVGGETDYDKAQLLLECWNKEGQFDI